MKKKLLNVIGLLAICLMLGNGVLKAADVVVAPGYNTLSEAVAAAAAGDVLILTSGEAYTNDVEISIDVPLTIKGDGLHSAEKMPPVLSFISEAGSYNGKVMFKVNANATFKDFGIEGFSDLVEASGGPAIKIFTAGVKVVLDGMIFQGNNQALSVNFMANCEIIEKNCVLFNVNCYNKEDNWNGFNIFAAGPYSTVTCFNNTFMNVTRLVFSGYFDSGKTQEDFNHNTLVNIFGDTGYPMWDSIAKITNNIFYNTQFRGYVGAKDDGYAGDFIGDWPNDVLMGDISIFDGPNKSYTITNNLKFTTKKVLDFNVANGITNQPFISEHSLEYATKNGWTIANNLLGATAVDPGFTLPDDAYTALFDKSLARRLPGNEGEWIGWLAGGAEKEEFIWPLPFNFKPTNSAIYKAGTDGYPLGDLNWFGKDVVEAWENGLESPITSIKNIKNESFQSAYISHDVLRFKGFDSAVDVEIYSILGQKMRVVKNVEEVNVADLKNGIYLIRVNGGDRTFKVVK